MRKIDFEWLVMAFLVLVLALLAISTSKTYGLKIADLSEENVETINVSTAEEKSLYGAIKGVRWVSKDGLPEEENIEWKEWVVTAYCGCVECVGKWHTDGYTLTASGNEAVEGVTIAADESIPFGTVIYLEGLGDMVVMDRGGAIKGNHLDLYCERHEDCSLWGMRTVRGYIK